MFDKVRISLGEGHLDKYTLFENKSLFSVYFHVFNTVEQDRFHTHAFDAVSFVLRGSYEEEQKLPSGIVIKKKVGVGVRYIPKDYNHRLLRSEPDTMSLLFAGPWVRYWTEENRSFTRTLTWGRREVSRVYHASAR